MAYSAPRNGRGNSKRKGVEHRHSKADDDKFFANRIRDLKKRLAKLDPQRDKSNYQYVDGQIKSLEKKLKGEPDADND